MKHFSVMLTNIQPSRYDQYVLIFDAKWAKEDVISKDEYSNMHNTMTNIRWRFVSFGEAALLVEADAPLEHANRAVLALAARLDAALGAGIVAVVPALMSLLVRFDPLQTSHDVVERHVRVVLHGLEVAHTMPARVVTIKVRYGGEDGPDLDDVAQQLALSPEAVVALHCKVVQRVLMIGFAPGFPYLGPLPPELTLPRRATPRTAVPPGSVAIAAGMSGIYPQRLPGGWHLIGRTDAVLFDPTHTPPSLVQPGDGVRFDPLPDGVMP
jgi:inhibitor of KinA